jgi:hypothetical protein
MLYIFPDVIYSLVSCFISIRKKEYLLYCCKFKFSIFFLATLIVVSLNIEVRSQSVLYIDINNFHATLAPDFYESYEHAKNIHINKYGSANWIFWPAEYTREDEGDDPQGLLGAFGVYLTLPDFTDKENKHHNYYHAAVWGDRGPYDDRMKVAYTAPKWEDPAPRSKRYRKWPDPDVKIDQSKRNKEDNDVVDSDLISEMMVENVIHSETGITIIRRAYAWSQQDHDDYIIVEFILENSGYIMEYNSSERLWNKAVKPSGWPQPLNDVWFALCFRFQPSALGCQQNGNWGAKLLTGKGHDAQHIYIGETYRQAGQRAEDSLRALISWDGDADNAAIDYDDTGNPHVLTGALLSPQYIGVSILHVDDSPHAKDATGTDDPEQPKTTMWRGTGPYGYAFEQIDWDHPDNIVYNYISSGKHQESAEAGGETRGGLDNIVEEHGYFLGFGPYNFQPNEVVRIVTAYAAGGISRHLAVETGNLWNAGEIDDDEKTAVLITGMDSLIAAFNSAKLMYEKTNSLTMCPEDILPPPPPKSFTVTSEIGEVNLEWDGTSSESVSDFAGYKLYRSYSSTKPVNPPAYPADTLYVKIWECGEGTDNTEIVNSFVDTDVKSLWTYRYYLTAFDKDGNESGRYYTLFPEDNEARPGWQPNESGSLNNIMAIPNPCINKAHQWGGRIKFVNLPQYCTIRIYTQSGNLVQVIEHPRPGDPADGDEYWIQDTIGNQYVASGVYIYSVESDQGNAVGRLIIIR